MAELNNEDREILINLLMKLRAIEYSEALDVGRLLSAYPDRIGLEARRDIAQRNIRNIDHIVHTYFQPPQ